MKRFFILFVATVMFSVTTPVQSHTSPEVQSTQKTVVLKVGGSCKMCKTRIEKTAMSLEGVSSAQWNLKNQNLRLNYDTSKTNVETVSKVLANVGHDTEKAKAEDAVYNALPQCCKYRK